ncbi:hypothetical protein E1297_10315 [Roseibium sp. RKSG952]|nr:hypothetical protein [Roseibium sp. RKSG952]
MKRPNPLPVEQMTSAERQAELCGLLARGLVRLLVRDASELSANEPESSLPKRPCECRHVSCEPRRDK